MAADPLIGQVVREYEVRAYLGSGGFGQVYRAVHRLMGVERGLKVLYPQFAADPAARARFFREARTGDTLRHPNIVAVHEVFEHGGQFWTVMDLVEGWTLTGRLTEGGPLPVRELLPILRGVAAGLDHAHEHGVIHCDIKPSNILLRRADGVALLTDFGLARLVTDRTQSMPNVAGTVPYMSPEQLGLNGASVGRASDVYSLTAVLYEMLTGEPPYGRGMEALSGHYGRFALRPVSGGRQGLPAALDGVLARGLSQDPGQRPPSAGALAREVDALVADEPTRLGAIPVPPSPPRYTAPPSPPPARRRPVRWPLFIPLAVVVAILVTIGSIEISSFAKGFVIGFENAGHTPSPTTSAGTPPTSAGNGPTSTPTSSGLASRPGRTVYNDDFSGNKGWQLGVNGASNSTLRRGTLGLSVDTVQIYGEKVPVGGSYQGTKVSMDVTRNTATGRAGLACTDSGGTARYAFWVWSDLVSIVRANSSGGTTIGQASLDGGWSSGQQINITAVCYPADGQMGLELLVDNQQVLDTTDGGYTGRSAAPIIVVEGVTNVDVHHLTVTALA